MRCIDTNVLVYAHRGDLPEHDDYRALLERLANNEEPLGVPDIALSGYLRVVTNRRIFTEPTSPSDAWTSIEALITAPATMLLRPGVRHWALFGELAQEINAQGNDIPDAYLAAYAVENNATWLSADRGFARFRRVQWRHPLDS